MQVYDQSLIFRSKCKDCLSSCLAVFSYELLHREVGKGRLVDGCSVHKGSVVTDFVMDSTGVTQLREKDMISVGGSLVRLETHVQCYHWSAFIRRSTGFLISGLSLIGLHYFLFDGDLRCIDERRIEHTGGLELTQRTKPTSS